MKKSTKATIFGVIVYGVCDFMVQITSIPVLIRETADKIGAIGFLFTSIAGICMLINNFRSQKQAGISIVTRNLTISSICFLAAVICPTGVFAILKGFFGIGFSLPSKAGMSPIGMLGAVVVLYFSTSVMIWIISRIIKFLKSGTGY